jgi:6-pyruvoyltetrahydropterin/6-carboxytetrahydropterin synthase
MVSAGAGPVLWLPVETLLRRTVRFGARPDAPRGPNGFAASPALDAPGRFVECSVECRGEPDPRSGYLLNIKVIDDAVHERVRPLLQRARDARPGDLAPLLRSALDALAAALPVAVDRLELALSPYHALAMTAADRQHAELLLHFDFAAAHRLHVPGWDPATNLRHFGKCNNPNGHGHNYRLEVRVGLPADRMGEFSIDALERAVQGAVIDRFDHKHLNLDCPEFAALNPTVENIALVIWRLLVGAFGESARLAKIRVWETPKTSAEYTGEAPT